ncbi:SDR family oxidoreductase [Paracoccus litorisediminis]|uniref:NAD(P)H-binding protein n=1 Tax=Paracoccus litorisediminis TaxID=2006130 RepID=A0A844HR21_9RHOB|nr:SDR family oxidoreductase [Paracoccus litorisediminis]MTH61599.1 NAD(P)H-binding protein [Paracoccus litorisediminis]
MTIAVTGSTGQLGRLVIAALKQKLAPSNIVALARSTAKAADLGVTVREADYGSVAAIETALQGVDTLLLISSSELGQRAEQHRNVIRAAQAAGVSRIVYTSLLRADTSTLSLAPEHVETEVALKQSGLRHTILRNGWYTENYTGSIPAALANGAFIGSAGNGRISSAARADYAQAAAEVVTGEGHDGKVYELSGDESYTLADLAAEISRQTGKDIPYTDLPEADYAAILTKVGLPEGIAQAIASWDVAASQGALYDEGRTLSALIGRPTTPLGDVVAQALTA